MTHPLTGIWVTMKGSDDLRLARIGKLYTVVVGEGTVDGKYSGPIVTDFGPVNLEEEVEVWVIDPQGVLRGRGPALVDMTWTQFGCEGSFRSSGKWELP